MRREKQVGFASSEISSEKGKLPSNAGILALEEEIKKVWEDLARARDEVGVRDQLKAWQLVRLMEVHNQLDIEAQRQTEAYFRELVGNLRLEEIGGRPSILSGVKCKISGGKEQKNRANLKRHNTVGVFSHLGHSEQAEKENLERKQKIHSELMVLSRKESLSEEDLVYKSQLMDELRRLQ